MTAAGTMVIMLSDEDVARICHSAAMEYQAVLNDLVPSQPWHSLPRWQRDIVVESVRLARMGASPRELHESWCERMAAIGWKRGPVKNLLLWEHPRLVPWEELPLEYQRMNRQIVSIVRAHTVDV